jgi:hypothetical protein
MSVTFLFIQHHSVHDTVLLFCPKPEVVSRIMICFFYCYGLYSDRLVDRIVKSAPTEGPAEEEALCEVSPPLLSEQAMNAHTTSGTVSASLSPTVMIDEEKLQRLKRIRNKLGPRLCCCCLVDVRHYKSAKHCNSCGACVVDADEHFDFIA